MISVARELAEREGLLGFYKGFHYSAMQALDQSHTQRGGSVLPLSLLPTPPLLYNCLFVSLSNYLSV